MNYLNTNINEQLYKLTLIINKHKRVDELNINLFNAEHSKKVHLLHYLSRTELISIRLNEKLAREQ